MGILESQSEVRYNMCIIVGRNETVLKKFAYMVLHQKVNVKVLSSATWRIGRRLSPSL